MIFTSLFMAAPTWRFRCGVFCPCLLWILYITNALSETFLLGSSAVYRVSMGWPVSNLGWSYVTTDHDAILVKPLIPARGHWMLLLKQTKRMHWPATYMDFFRVPTRLRQLPGLGVCLPPVNISTQEKPAHEPTTIHCQRCLCRKLIEFGRAGDV